MIVTFVLILCSQSISLVSSFTLNNAICRSIAPMTREHPQVKNYRSNCKPKRYFDASIQRTCRSKSSLRYTADDEVDIIGTVTILVPSSSQESSSFGSKSPVSNPSYETVAKQLARKVRQFSDGKISTRVVNPHDDSNDACLASNALIALGLTTPADIQYLSRTFRKRREKQQNQQLANTCQFAVGCGGNYAPIVGPYDEANPSILATLAPWTDIASGKRLATQMTELFGKYTSDEFALAIMLFFNQFSGTKIPWVQHSIDVTWEKGLFQNAKEIYAMITKCGPCIAKCLNDENCSSCIKGEVTNRSQTLLYQHESLLILLLSIG
jgi:hypothetical protein